MAATGADDALDVVEDPLADRAAERQQAIRIGVDRVDDGGRVIGIGVVDDLVGPMEQLLGVVVGHPEDAGEHADRQRPGDVLDGVQLGLRERLVEHGLDEPGGGVAVGRDHRLRERRVDELAQPCVAWWICLEHRLAGLDGVRGELLDLGPADLGRVRAPVLVHRDELVPARHGPKASAGVTVGRGLVDPCDRRLAAQPVVPTVRNAFGVDVVGDDVDTGHGVGPTRQVRSSPRVVEEPVEHPMQVHERGSR